VDSVDEEMLELMRRSGCTELGVGVESGSDRILQHVKKGYTRQQALDGIKLIRRVGIRPIINIMIGFPTETVSDVRDTMSLIKELNVVTNINTVTPYPDTDLYDECLKFGLIGKEIDWSKVSQHSPFNGFVHEMTLEQYRELLDEMVILVDRINGRKAATLTRYIDHANRIFIDSGRNPARFLWDISLRLVRKVISLTRLSA
jgi:radical SAM superfamily enzyme YgiQ (UPF0313 family)